MAGKIVVILKDGNDLGGHAGVEDRLRPVQNLRHQDPEDCRQPWTKGHVNESKSCGQNDAVYFQARKKEPYLQSQILPNVSNLNCG